MKFIGGFFIKEQDVEELLQRTERTLIAIQTLKEKSDKLTNKYPKTYEELISILAGFLDFYKDEIQILYDYVLWLAEKDKCAPSILYSYRVWGTTRRSQRFLNSIFSVSEEHSKEDVTYTEVFCGLWLDGFYTIDKVRMEIGVEISENP